MIKLIIGLGNPGEKYQNTRHNIGFMVIDRLYEKYQNSSFQKKFGSEFAEIKINNTKVFLLKPLTYMNISGKAVAECANFYKIPSEEVLVIYDDVDMDVGKIRIKQGGGSGGHNGVKSIDESIKKNYFKLKIGISKPLVKQIDISSYVLSRFTQDEEVILNNSFKSIEDNTNNLIGSHFENFMNNCAIDYNNLKKSRENGI